MSKKREETEGLTNNGKSKGITYIIGNLTVYTQGSLWFEMLQLHLCLYV